MNENSLNLSEFSYAEINDMQAKLITEKKNLEKRIAELEQLSKVNYNMGNYDMRKEIDNEDIPEVEGKLSEVNDKLKQINAYYANLYTKAEMLAKDIEIELTEKEANAIIDMYSVLKSESEKKYHDVLDDIVEHGEDNNYDFDDELEEMHHEKEQYLSQVYKYEKVIVAATNSICRKL